MSRLEEEAAAAMSALVEGSDSFGEVAQAAEAVIAMEMWLSPEFIEELESLGAVTSVGDQIMQDQGWSNSWTLFGETDGLFVLEAAVNAIDDPELGIAWSHFLTTPVGSDAEAIAAIAFQLRLYELVLEGLEETASLLEAGSSP